MGSLYKVMSKILFVWPVFHTDQGLQNGVAQISGVLKRAGHETALVMPGEDCSYYDVLKKIRSFQPDFIGFSVTALQRKHVFNLEGFVRRETDAKLVVGGVDVILNPEVYTHSDLFDYVCVGEGEEGFLQLASGQKDPVNFVRRIASSPPRWVSGEMKSFSYENAPVEDYDIFPFYQIIKKRNGWLGDFFIGRGCPYSCSYCSNSAIKNKLFPKNPKDYIRFKDINKVLWEIQWGIEHYDNPQMIVFGDDTFTLNEEYMTAFLFEYTKRIGLPFVCNVRPGTLDSDKAQVLKGAGCYQIKIGVECGNEQYRKEILKRNESNDKIRETFELADEYGLSTSAFLMIGLPDETPDLIMDTLEFVADLEPDRFKFSVFYPFPGTELYDYCKEKDLINWPVYDTLENYSTKSGLKFDEATRAKIKSVMKDVGKAVNRVLGDDTYWIAHRDYMGVKRK